MLTEKQFQYLKAIQSYAQESNRLPTLQTLADIFEVSKSCAANYVNILIRKGYVNDNEKMHGISYRKDIDLNSIKIKQGNWKSGK